MTQKEKPKRRLGDAPQPVIQRWWRYKSMAEAQHVARVISRWRLPHAERARRLAVVSTFETFKSLAIKHENGKFPGLSTLVNIGLYLLIAHRDIQAVKIDALTHPDDWTRKLNARIILLTIYEWDADKVTGRQLKTAMEMMFIPQDLQREAVECLRLLRIVQRKATKQFSFIRNATIAHRDPNALVQYRAIRDLDVAAVMALAVEFFSALEKFISIQTKLIIAADTPRSLVNQWLIATRDKEANSTN